MRPGRSAASLPPATQACEDRLQRFFPLTIELTRSAMWAMAHPIRFRIWELLREGPSTASRVGRRLGESRGSASYHLRVLARAGLIVEDESLGTRRERWWVRPEEPMMGIARGDPEGR